MFMVFDSNAKTGPRKHEIPTKTDTDGTVLVTKTYSLSAEVPTEMEEAHAMFFLRDPSFQVYQGEVLLKPLVVREGGLGGFKLNEGEVIATYDELSKDALYRRCKVLTGSEGITAKSKPEEMIAFILARAKPPVGLSRGSEGKVGELDASTLDNLLAA